MAADLDKILQKEKILAQKEKENIIFNQEFTAQLTAVLTLDQQVKARDAEL